MANQLRMQGFANAQDQAQLFLTSLLALSQQPQTFSSLAEAIRHWRKNAPKVSFAHQLSFFNSPAFIKKLAQEKKLKHYLQDSISYLFVRDLDLDLNQAEVASKIDTLAEDLAKQLSPSNDPRTTAANTDMMTQGFLWAIKHQAESAFIWLSAKIYRLKQELPEALAEHQGLRKLLKVVAGVLMNSWQSQGDAADFDQAIRLGYYYGLTYPLIDDLQDSQVLTPAQQQSFDQALEASILTGVVHKPTEQTPWLTYVFDELAEAFTFIQQQQGDHFEAFLDQAYIFLKSQQQTSGQLWLDMINKSSRSRILADALVSNQVQLGNYQYFGLFNQLHDDLKDVELDYQEGNITPFVALIYHNQTYQGIHPYKLYWALLHHLIYHCYREDPKIKQLLIKRCINSHKSLLERLGKEPFLQRLQQLTQGCPELDELQQALLTTLEMPLEMAWLDKFFSTQLQEQLQQDKAGELKQRIEGIQAQIKNLLPLPADNELEEAGNYSLAAGGKYFRGVLCTLYSQDCLNLEFAAIAPVIRFIEYMHTASLILDDKPSQDNSDLRRGQPTLHQHLQSEAKAEIAAVNLIFKAVEVHAGMGIFKAENLLASLEYASQLSQKICHGQWLDLDSQGKTLSLEALEEISLKKTAYAIESALVLPAILAGQPKQQLARLKQYAHHLGIAFQIKDDLLDVEADNATLGKPAQLDQQNQTSTFVRCLGRQGATEQLYRHYYQAIEAVREIPNSQALVQIASWLVERQN
ncbi:polyprenyl synthetase family protein [Marinospirillum perlucidum]|uniref:polyprenyl synthetase family protein n=1 Tax=Marinospirillum perlucidum TaxID=1982602 RepID=UPI000DF19E66|nr:polyprenyl synthetase family protein [Marinospirillum perlucidum]